MDGCSDCERRMAMILEYERRAYVAEGRVAALQWFLRVEGDHAIEAYGRKLEEQHRQQMEDDGPGPGRGRPPADVFQEHVARNRKALGRILEDPDSAYEHYKRAVLGLSAS